MAKLRPLIRLLSAMAFFACGVRSAGQSREIYEVRTIAFYNLENLFDIVNDSLVFDDERTPGGKDHWTAERYQRKIAHIAEALSGIGRAVTGSSPDLIGVCEIENRQVLEDLTGHPNLLEQHYQIIHFDSPDERGIDVALLYKRAAFVPLAFQSRRLLLSDEEGERDYTRDQLVVSGLLDDQFIYLIVNHWPSRSGGEARSLPFRLAAAALNRRIIDSISETDASPNIIGMGDFNDNPTDPSFKQVLKVRGDRGELEPGDLFNPMERLYKRGIGSLAYRDKWSLFDQIYCTATFLSGTPGSFFFWKAGIYRPPQLVTPSGRYKGYPLRTYASGNYTAGYSDHFPVYAYFIRKATQEGQARGTEN